MTPRADNDPAPMPDALGPAVAAAKRRRTAIALLLGCCAVAHLVVTRLSWSDIPLQTDTGMWAYLGGRILDGALPYRDLWESKPPGIYFTFAAVEWLFGAAAERALLWMDAAVSLAVFGVTYVVARRFASRVAAAGAVLLLSIIFCHRVVADWGGNVEKFVALFEMLACLLVLGAFAGRGGWRGWLAAGVCCGMAGLFKQTGILFLAAASVAGLREGIQSGESPRGALKPIGLLIAGAAAVWLPVVLGMLAAGVFPAFWHQVISYDLLRVASGGLERSRLSNPAHWSAVGGSLRLTLVLFGPALVGACCWARRRREPVWPIPLSGAHLPDSGMFVVVIYWLTTTLLFALAPYGYGHYLLQAAPAAAVIVAWVFDRLAKAGPDRPWAWAALAAVLLSQLPLADLVDREPGPTTASPQAAEQPEGRLNWTLADHYEFTFDSGSRYRLAYDHQRGRLLSIVEAIQERTAEEQSVMLWPPDYAVSYYAGRPTPLEMSNADVIFKGKINRLDPPIERLLDHLQAHPPDVIVDSTALRVQRPSDAASAEPYVMVQAGVSLLEAPNDDHQMIEGRLLAPLKRWLRDNYGGQQRVAHCTFYYHGQTWRPWQEYLPTDSD